MNFQLTAPSNRSDFQVGQPEIPPGSIYQRFTGVIEVRELSHPLRSLSPLDACSVECLKIKETGNEEFLLRAATPCPPPSHAPSPPALHDPLPAIRCCSRSQKGFTVHFLQQWFALKVQVVAQMPASARWWLCAHRSLHTTVEQLADAIVTEFQWWWNSLAHNTFVLIGCILRARAAAGGARGSMEMESNAWCAEDTERSTGAVLHGLNRKIPRSYVDVHRLRRRRGRGITVMSALAERSEVGRVEADWPRAL